MNTDTTRRADATRGTALCPNFYEGPSDARGDYHARIRCFTYLTGEGLVAGRNTSQTFTIDRPAKEVWPYIKDFNLWQNGYGYYYSGVVGDLEGEHFFITSKDTPRKNAANEQLPKSAKSAYQVIKVLPEHLIVIRQPVPEDGSSGGVSPGFHVIMLTEHDGKTTVTLYTEHAARTSDKTEEEALARFRNGAEETLRKFRDSFIPTLKRLIYEAKG